MDAPERFARSRSVGPRLELTPRRDQSGEINRTGRITKGATGIRELGCWRRPTSSCDRAHAGHR
uniref:transposase n=1 Tax=Roseixanthobacter finlandensis TaxID=3119922 RepID=UPI00372CF745